MTILIVDDQVSVVSGLFFGINWKKIGIQKVLKAYSAAEARDIIRMFHIDIILCDIEMPVENGLQLFSWVREQGYETECIFLTAHADFIYAKEAIGLGGFDYILQPARYEEIENDIVRLIDKIQIKREKEEMAYCGDIIKKRKSIFMDAVLHRLLFESGEVQTQAMKDLQKLGITINGAEDSCVVLFVLEDEKMLNWDSDLIKYTISNILEEIFLSYGYGVLLCTKERGRYIAYFYRKEPCILEKRNYCAKTGTLYYAV